MFDFVNRHTRHYHRHTGPMKYKTGALLLKNIYKGCQIVFSFVRNLTFMHQFSRFCPLPIGRIFGDPHRHGYCSTPQSLRCFHYTDISRLAKPCSVKNGLMSLPGGLGCGTALWAVYIPPLRFQSAELPGWGIIVSAWANVRRGSRMAKRPVGPE